MTRRMQEAVRYLEEFGCCYIHIKTAKALYKAGIIEICGSSDSPLYVKCVLKQNTLFQIIAEDAGLAVGQPVASAIFMREVSI